MRRQRSDKGKTRAPYRPRSKPRSDKGVKRTPAPPPAAAPPGTVHLAPRFPFHAVSLIPGTAAIVSIRAGRVRDVNPRPTDRDRKPRPPYDLQDALTGKRVRVDLPDLLAIAGLTITGLATARRNYVKNNVDGVSDPV